MGHCVSGLQKRGKKKNREQGRRENWETERVSGGQLRIQRTQMCSNKSTQGAERGQNQIKHDSSNGVRKNNTKAKNKKVFAKVFLTSISFTLWHSKQVWHKKWVQVEKRLHVTVSDSSFLCIPYWQFLTRKQFVLVPRNCSDAGCRTEKKDACVLQQRGTYQSVAAVVGL